MAENRPLKINLGSATKVKKGFVNCDVRGFPEVDRVFDLTDFPWPFETESAEIITSEETIEHLPRIAMDNFFKECYRILEHGGTLFLQCPDIGNMCEMYYEDQICDCVPHKAKKLTDFKADPDCVICEGQALVNPTRWLMSFIGAQKHEYDLHRMIFTQDIMRDYLEKHGFADINMRDDLYKIKVKAKKP